MTDADVTVSNIETANVGSPPANDTLTVRLVVVFIAMIVLSVIVGTVVLTLYSKSMPDAVIALGGVGLGALGAMLASTASRSPKD